MADTVALIVAAGRGERAGGGVPKQFRELAGKPVLRWAIEAFLGHGRIDAVQAVIHSDDRERYEAATVGLGLSRPSRGRDASGFRSAGARGPDAVPSRPSADPRWREAVGLERADRSGDKRPRHGGRCRPSPARGRYTPADYRDGV